MKNKLMVIFCITATALAGAIKASASPETDPAAVGADALLGRPLCFAATIIGTAVFIVTVPVAATSHSLHSTAEALVLKPARATFIRPLGDFDYYPDDPGMARHHKHQKSAQAKAPPGPAVNQAQRAQRIQQPGT